MPYPFPPEIWKLVARHAIARPWTSHQFNPPQGDFDGIEGFAQASPVFKEIVQSLKDESLAISLMDLTRAQIGNTTAQRVKYLQVTAKNLDEASSSPGHPWKILRNLGNFTMIRSISFSPSGTPLIFLKRMEKLPFAKCLESIDVRGMWELEIRTHLSLNTRPSNGEFVCFPNLLRLRLSHEAWIQTDRVPGLVVGIVASFFEGCQNLELFSIHTALDDDRWLEQRVAHMMSIEHLQPSEGYTRDIADCPLCFAEYDHSRIIRKENTVTRHLAEKFPKLSEVRFANLWASHVQDEHGQRGTKITREGGNIVLTRDDGMNE